MAKKSKKPAKKVKPAKKKIVAKAKKPAAKKVAPKKVAKVPAKKVVVAAKKPILKPLPKPTFNKTPGKPMMKAGKPATKTAPPVQPKMIKSPPKRAYQMHVEQNVLPQVIPHIVPGAGRIPSVTANFADFMKVRKVEDGRCYFVDDEGNPHVPSLIEMQLLSYKWFLTEGLKELLEEISPITDFSGKKLELRI